MKRVGFIYKKQKLVPGKLDSNQQEIFKLEYSLLKGNLKSDEKVYFMDSVHPQYQTRARCGWIKKNQNKTLPTFSGWKRKHIIGAVSLQDSEVITTNHPKVNGDYIIEFLKKIEFCNATLSKIYVICDNAGYHKSKKIKEYLQGSKIELIYLPPYSPNLNPIERLWKFMHSIVTNNKFYWDFDQFSSSLDRFFNNIANYKYKIKTLVNDNFQTIKIDHFLHSSS